MNLFKTGLVLGLLSAVGPFTIDMYLPALPEIGRDLDASVTQVQMTLSAFFIAFGLSQLFWGPWADQVGRKLPIYVGIGIFAIGTIGCALAPSIGMLVAMRVVQGVGAAVVMVVPRAIIRDMFTGPQGTRLMAMVMLVISVSPMLAPLAGSGLLAFGGWRLLFWMLAVVAVGSIFVTSFALKETLPVERRRAINLASLRAGAKTLLSDPIFLGLTFIGGFGMASFFVFISSASFVYTEQFGLTEVQFSLAFAANAIGFFGASQLAAPISERFGVVPVIRVAVGIFAFFTTALLLVALAGGATLWTIMALLFCGNAGLGFVIPTTMVMALDEHGEIAGLASSLGGTLQMVAGGLMIAVSSPFFDGTATPMIAAIAVCGWVAMILTLIVLPKITARDRFAAAT
ncbi:multidrug effflux MFS transporter [Pelagovum pacificum]|uniref:Bcr/CflA family efflux transporter n=1 Tax=Pelagovum pacificum TaxID=2588711 RepID=A0A5C5GD66_9RHOB|nr:multidrug effflux MFS transporter [Pelagovum pacificum]QQA44432.1 multidrug effflux MFS transporter [Pelagovum pacificum]TNY32450.1 multidrug effflux MFS transporter [Pelagovum pacificum]